MPQVPARLMAGADPVMMRYLLEQQAQQDELAASSPAGIIQMYAGTTPPNGWLFCDGSEVSRNTYPELFAAIGTTFGSGNGSTTFQLPDLRGRAPIGVGSGITLTARSLGDTGGKETHTLTTDELPVHNHPTIDPGHTHTFVGISHGHSVTDPGHSHGITDPGHEHGVTEASGTGTSGSDPGGSTSGTTTTDTTGITINSASTGVTVDSAVATGTNSTETTGVQVGDTGAGQAHPTMSPFLAIGFIIRVR